MTAPAALCHCGALSTVLVQSPAPGGWHDEEWRCDGHASDRPAGHRAVPLVQVPYMRSREVRR